MESAPVYETQTQPAADPTRARILDADVSKEARLSRQTVYRYFPGRHALLAALVLREEERIIAAVKQAIEPHRELRPAMEAAFVTTLKTFREHPLLDKVMAAEPQELLPFLTVEANPVMSLGIRLTEQVFSTRTHDVPIALMHRAAE